MNEISKHLAARILDDHRLGLERKDPDAELTIKALCMGVDALLKEYQRENPEPLALEQVREHIASDLTDARPLWVEVWMNLLGTSGWLYANDSTADHPETGEVIPIASVEWLLKEFGDDYGALFRCWREKPTRGQMRSIAWSVRKPKEVQE